MSQSKKYTCLRYNNIGFLVPNTEIFTASCIDNVIDSLEFAGEKLNCIDFDKAVNDFKVNYTLQETRTCIIVYNKGLFPEGNYFALITSAECKVVEIEDEYFRTAGMQFRKIMKLLGIEKCFFTDQGVYYLMDANIFLGYSNE